MSLYSFQSDIFTTLLARAIVDKLAALQVAKVPPYNAPLEEACGVQWRWWSALNEPHIYLRLQIVMGGQPYTPIEMRWEQRQALEASEQNAMRWIREALASCGVGA